MRRSGDVSIAYQVMGAGPIDLIMVENFCWTDQDRNYGERSFGRIQ